MHSTKLRIALLLLIAAAVAMGTGLALQNPDSARAKTGVTVQGFGVNQTGGGNINTGWTTGNLGDTWDEGDWIPYQFTFTDAQDDFPGLTDFEAFISWDFFMSQAGADTRFADLVRDIQVCLDERDDTEAWVGPGGTALPDGTVTEINAAQVSVGEFEWSDCTLLDLPTNQVNVLADGDPGGVDDGRHMFIVYGDDLLDAGVDSSADTFTIYFQLHLSRTFIWDNSLQSAYATGDTADWGGDKYDDEPFLSDDRTGSGFAPGSSTHITIQSVSGDKTVPIPIPPAPTGEICGVKFHDENFDGGLDAGEDLLEGWDIWAHVVVEGIEVSFKQTTDSNGEYCFVDLTPGLWTVSEDLESGWVQTYPSGDDQVGVCVDDTTFEAGDNPNPGPVGWECTLTGTPQGDVDFGNAQPAARISIDPPSGVNEVGETHPLTCLVEVVISSSGFEPAPDGTLCELRILSGPGTLSGGDGATTGFDESCTTSGGTGECQVDLDSNDVGETVVEACSTVTVLGVTLDEVCTDGTGENSVTADKFWVDAAVEIEADATNEVGEEHVFTITVTTDSETGVTVDFINITPTGDTSFITSDTCVDDDTSTATSCTVTVDSSATGTATIGADIEVQFSAGTFTATVLQSTDGTTTGSGLENSDPATKTWVDARISIAESDANRINDPHTFTVTVEKDLGDGGSWVPAPGVTVTAVLAAGSVGSITGGTCTTGDTDALGQCTVTVNSAVIGSATVDVSATVTIDTVNILVDTATSTNVGTVDNVKTWVDAFITITPDGTNFIHDEHEFTCHIEADDGTGSAPVENATCVGEIDAGDTANSSFVGGDNDCVTDANGDCTLTITSDEPGVTDVSASTTITVLGVSISIETDGTGDNSGPATKTWIAAAVTFTKTFEVGPFTTPGGTVCFTLSRDGGLPTGVPSPQTAEQCKTVAASVDFTWAGLVDGDYTITEDSSLVTPAGAYIDISDIEFIVREDCTSETPPPPCVEASDSPTAFDLGDFNDPLADGALQVRKLLGPAGTLWTGTAITFYVCQNDPVTQDTAETFAFCQANAVETLVIPTDGNPAESGALEEAYYTVCEDVPSGYVVAPAQCQAVQVLAGGAAAEAEVTFTNTPPSQGCTPGWWKNQGKPAYNASTDDLAEAVAAAVLLKWGNVVDGTHTSLFREIFDLTTTEMSDAGLNPDLTLLGAIELNGGGLKALARHGAAALLNSLSVDYPFSADDVLQMVHDGIVNESTADLADLSAANELDHSACPTS